MSRSAATKPLSQARRALFPALFASAAIASGCFAPSSEPSPEELGTTSSSIEGGDPINQTANPVSIQFAMSTVALRTLFTDASGVEKYADCTGEILSANQILTAAHCKVGSATTVSFYRTAPLGDGSDDVPIKTIMGASGASVVVPPGVICDDEQPATFPSSCYTTWGPAGPGTATSHYADLAVLTLASPITLAAPNATTGYRAVLIGAEGSYAAGQASPAGPPDSWEVGAGKMNLLIKACDASTLDVLNPLQKMSWVAIFNLSASDSNPPSNSYGYFFTTTAAFGDPGDSGGPVYQWAKPVTPGTYLPYNLAVVGVTSLDTKCTQTLADGTVVSTIGQPHSNVYTSAVYPDNYAWIIQQGGVGASGLPSFGAALP